MNLSVTTMDKDEAVLMAKERYRFRVCHAPPPIESRKSSQSVNPLTTRDTVPLVATTTKGGTTAAITHQQEI